MGARRLKPDVPLRRRQIRASVAALNAACAGDHVILDGVEDFLGTVVFDAAIDRWIWLSPEDLVITRAHLGEHLGKVDCWKRVRESFFAI